MKALEAKLLERIKKQISQTKGFDKQRLENLNARLKSNSELFFQEFKEKIEKFYAPYPQKGTTLNGIYEYLDETSQWMDIYTLGRLFKSYVHKALIVCGNAH